MTGPTQLWQCTRDHPQQLSSRPLGKSVTTTTTLDANLLHCMATGSSLTACLHLCNQTPTEWYSKKQATVETAHMVLSLWQ